MINYLPRPVPVMAKRDEIDPIKHPFAAWLASTRDGRGLSMHALAAHAEISQAYVSKLESGNARPSRDMVIRLASELSHPDASEISRHLTINDALRAAGYSPEYDDAITLGPMGTYFDPGKGYVLPGLPQEVRNVEVPENPEDWPPELLAAMHYSQQLDPEARRVVYGLWMIQARAHAGLAQREREVEKRLKEKEARLNAPQEG